jgi:hypothetical protein
MELPADSSPGFPEQITDQLLYPKHHPPIMALPADSSPDFHHNFYMPSTNHGSAFMSAAPTAAQLL